MNSHSIRHAWFPPVVPKRKHNQDFDSESEWPNTYRPLSEPGLESRPNKRLRQLEGGLAELTLKPKNHEESVRINTDREVLVPSLSTLPWNESHETPLDSEAEPYITSIYEFALPPTGSGSSAASLPLRGEVSEANTSDEECMTKNSTTAQQINGSRMGKGVFVQGGEGIPSYTVYELENGSEKRKRDAGDEEHRLEKKGKRSWYEPQKDRVVVLDLDSSDDESVTRSPRRRRSAFSLSIGSGSTSPRSQTETQDDAPDFVINPKLLSHISSPGTGIPSIPREEISTQAVVLYKPIPWISDPQESEPEVIDIEDVASLGNASVEASPLNQDDDAMDIDS